MRVQVDLTPQTLHFWTIPEFAERHKVTPLTVHRWISKGNLTSCKRGGKHVIFPEQEQAFLGLS